MTPNDDGLEDRVLVSSCLMGVACRYDGRRGTVAPPLAKDAKVFHACPEALGGLLTPRARAEIVGGNGFDVLDGKATVKTDTNEDVTKQYVEGAKRLLKIAQAGHVQRVILQDYSPACGVSEISDGTFQRQRIPGVGVAAALLIRNGFSVDGWCG
jgi:uncharacterized protein YbbK (DUF523 family)